jgi:hypothetical protein
LLFHDDDGYVQLRAPAWPANQRVARRADAPGLRICPVFTAYRCGARKRSC